MDQVGHHKTVISAIDMLSDGAKIFHSKPLTCASILKIAIYDPMREEPAVLGLQFMLCTF